MPRSLLTGFVLRSVVLWAGLRALLTALFAAPILPDILPHAGPSNPLAVPPHVALAIAGLLSALVLVDSHAMRERMFLANLGIGRRTVAMIAFLCAAALETLLAVALAVI